MRKVLIMLLVLFSLTSAAQPYRIDVKNSTLTWIGHAQTGIYSPKGTLEFKSGTIVLSQGKLKAGTVTIDMGTLKQDNEEMQEHLRGKDFFDVVKYPEAILILDKTDGTTATGKLTVKGNTQPVRFEVIYIARDDKILVRATATIDRTKYGIKYNSSSFFQDLGSYAIRNTFEIEVTVTALTAKG